MTFALRSPSNRPRNPKLGKKQSPSSPRAGDGVGGVGGGEEDDDSTGRRAFRQGETRTGQEDGEGGNGKEDTGETDDADAFAVPCRTVGKGAKGASSAAVVAVSR